MQPANVGSWVVYLLRCADGSLYTGVTTDVRRRCRQHNAGTASRYTRARRPVRLVYQEAHPHRGSALRREAAIKRLSRRQKLQLLRVGRRRASGPEGRARGPAT
jgi:putative endonuclease